MKNTIDFMNAIKAKTGAPSDYALAKILDTSRQVICGYMAGKHVMSNENALKAALILEIDQFYVLAAVEVERAKTDAEKRAWTNLFERLGGVAATVLIGIMLNGFIAPNQAIASAQPNPTSEHFINYTK